ncbi:ArsR family transcriptional regulator [Enterococcus faecalis]|uniref:ArsR family transcriptional regulator n=1 Tax=Enterococcus faecalis TaxID=1351 RepID=UPI0009AC51DA|nr:ArsR family transcriptional regulator [Enterococcus faecalis]EGO7618548.1 ArsR family transcriptional regulator [Enterococcus faecalis]EGO7913601.1 ArsR family transcriptional regulator [Enterococcus faecalis]EHG5971746.1 ArsR family transcriptional regulator [Enterococcus faecalis]EHU8864065.1 ArsR family transcriptional regulator [Enterococcus faecalis]
MNYKETSNFLQVSSEPNRLEIVALFSYGTLCFCNVLTHLEFIQPTFSHYMKVLEKS